MMMDVGMVIVVVKCARMSWRSSFTAERQLFKESRKKFLKASSGTGRILFAGTKYLLLHSEFILLTISQPRNEILQQFGGPDGL